MIVENEKNEKMDIKIMFTFKVEELNKEYIVYTIYEEKDAEDELVFISEIDLKKEKVKSIKFNEKEIVLDAYEKIKEKLLNK